MPLYKKTAWLIFTLSAASLFFILIFRSSNVSTLPSGWDKSNYVTPYDMRIKNIRLAQKGNIVAVVYEGKKNKTSGIFVSLSFDEGAKFLQPVKVASVSSITDMNPDVSISPDGHVAVAWQELRAEEANSHIYYSISPDMGATWPEPVRIASLTEMELLPKVLYDGGGKLHFFYNGYKDTGFNLFHIICEDEKIYSRPEPLAEITAGLRGIFFPAVHSSGKYIYIVWQGKEKMNETLSDHLYFIRSDNFGKDWSSNKLITKSRFKDSSPYIASYNDDIYLVYQNDESKNWAIKLMKGTDRGDKWQEPVTASITNADCYSPSIVRTDDDSLYIVWHDARDKIPGIFVRKFEPGVQNPVNELKLSAFNVPAKKPIGFSSGRKITLFWEESGRLVAKNSDIYAEPPAVYSPTHPENVWSKSSRAIIKWSRPADESGIVGYATFLKMADDKDSPEIDPTVQNIEGNITEYRTPELGDGISYFYIRSVDGAGNYSKTVRYKILVSKNPPSMPVVNSSTHPDGKAVDSKTAIFSWSIQDMNRLKGFVYCISKNTIRTPDTFTKEKEVKFDNLSNGRYFFSVRAVDKTNSISPVSTYEIIVGGAKKLEPEFYRKIARGIIDEKPEPATPPRPRIPYIELDMPFDLSKPFDKPSFKAEIKTKNIDYYEIIGYSYFIGKDEDFLSDRINLTKSVVTVSGLKDGDYILGVKCRLAKNVNGASRFLWTEPVLKKFNVRIPDTESRTITYAQILINRMRGNSIPVVILLIVMFVSVLTIGFGSKLSFYSRLLGLKFGNVFRIFL